MKLAFSSRAWEDYRHWLANNRDVLRRLNGLIMKCQRTPFTGTGKPEPLEGDLKGCRSRRVTL